MPDELQPVSPAWEAPSLLFGRAALCRDEQGHTWLCRLSEGAWLRMRLAERIDIEAFRWCQRLAGNPVEEFPGIECS